MMLQITLPDELEKWVIKQAEIEGYESAEAYIIAMVRALMAKEAAANARDAGLVFAAIEEDGEDIEATPEWWHDFKAELNRRHVKDV